MMVNGFGSISKHFNTSQNSKIESKQEENKRENSTDKEENSDGNDSQKTLIMTIMIKGLMMKIE